MVQKNDKLQSKPNKPNLPNQPEKSEKICYDGTNSPLHYSLQVVALAKGNLTEILPLLAVC